MVLVRGALLKRAPAEPNIEEAQRSRQRGGGRC
jgi:hypothetical protein